MSCLMDYRISDDIVASIKIGAHGSVTGTVRNTTHETIPSVRIHANGERIESPISLDDPKAGISFPKTELSFKQWTAFESLPKLAMQFANLCFNRYVLFFVDREYMEKEFKKLAKAARENPAAAQDLTLNLALTLGVYDPELIKFCLLTLWRELIRPGFDVPNDLVEVMIEVAQLVSMEPVQVTGEAERWNHLMDYLKTLSTQAA